MDKAIELIAEFFIRGIWESAMFLFGTLIIANAKIPVKKYLLSSFVFAIIALFVRQLPISYGIHTMLILICLNLIVLLLFSVNLEQSIKSTIIVTCVLFAAEGLNAIVLQLIYGKEELNNILAGPINKVVYFIPSTILFGLFNLITYKLLIKKRKVRADAGTVKRSDSE